MIQRVGKFITKSRSKPDVVSTAPNSRVYNSSGVETSNYSHPSRTVEKYSDSITYTNKLKGEPFRSNRCVQSTIHELHSVAPGYVPLRTNHASPAGSYTMYQGGAQYGVPAHTSAVATARAAFGVNLGSAELGANGQLHVNNAAERLRPDLTTVSIPNFLADIEDIKTLYVLWKKSLGVARNVAGATLNYKFGIKPTFGDLKALVDSVALLKQRVKAFEDLLGTVYTGHQRVVGQTITKSGTFMTGSDVKTYWTGTVKRSVDVHVKWAPQPLAVMNGFDKVLRGLLDSLGFELNPRIIWDALPFTFVLDWFFGVGSWLDNFKVDALELPIKYLDCCVQYKEEMIIESRTDFIAFGNNLNTVSVPASVTQSKYFERMPIFPDYATLKGLGWKMPTLNQFNLLVNLAVVLAPKNKHF